MKKLHLTLVTLTSVLALSLMAGCSGGPETAAKGGDPAKEKKSDGKKIELVYWNLFTGGDGDFMNQMVDEFNKTHPNISVQTLSMPAADYYPKLMTSVASGKGPDIGIAHTSKLPELVNEGVVTELDPITKVLNVNWGMFNQNILNSTIYNGKHYAIPIDTHPFVMYYNKDLLKQAGLLDDKGKPIMENSAQGFMTFAAKLKNKMPQGTFAFSFPYKSDTPFRFWWSLYSQLGAKDVVADDLKTPAIDMEKAAKAAKFINDLFASGAFPKNMEPSDTTKVFQSGKSAVLLNGVWVVGTLSDTKGLDFGVMPLPKFYDKEATWGDSHTLILPLQQREDKEKQQAATTFATWIVENGQMWAKAGHIPSKSDISNNPEFKKLPHREEYVSVSNSVVFQRQSAYNWPIKDAIVRNLDTIWAGSATPENAFKKVAEEMKSVVK